jgi:hypothetical protein
MLEEKLAASPGTTVVDPEARMEVRSFVWIPTPEEIADETARIRATWSEGERQRRAVRCPPWAVPEVTTRTARSDVE